MVAGATRGAGRGIAAALGEAGATVVCTGRSSRMAQAPRSDYARSETIEETAELVTSLGGTGIAAVVDHLDSGDVQRLAAQIREDHGHIDVLVNDIWGGELLTEWNTPVWEHDLDNGLRILRLAIDTHLITSHHLLPLLIDRPGGLLGGDDRWHRSAQRVALPAVRVLRPGQGRREPPRVLPGARAGAARCHRGRPHARVAPVGDDARQLPCRGGDVA